MERWLPNRQLFPKWICKNLFLCFLKRIFFDTIRKYRAVSSQCVLLVCIKLLFSLIFMIQLAQAEVLIVGNLRCFSLFNDGDLWIFDEIKWQILLAPDLPASRTHATNLIMKFNLRRIYLKFIHLIIFIEEIIFSFLAILLTISFFLHFVNRTQCPPHNAENWFVSNLRLN